MHMALWLPTRCQYDVVWCSSDVLVWWWRRRPMLHVVIVIVILEVMCTKIFIRNDVRFITNFVYTSS